MKRFFYLSAVVSTLFAQVPPPVIVTIDLENIVVYAGDTPDISKLAAATSRTTVVPSNNFYPVLWVSDIVAVNGKPAKGTWTVRGNQLFRSPTLAAGTAIADSGGAFFDWIFDLMQRDGTPVGSLMAVGTGGEARHAGSSYSDPPGQYDGDRRHWHVPGSTRPSWARWEHGRPADCLHERGSCSSPRAWRRHPSLRVSSISHVPAGRHYDSQRGPLSSMPATTHWSRRPDRRVPVKSFPCSPRDSAPHDQGLIPGQPFPASPLQPVNSPRRSSGERQLGGGHVCGRLSRCGRLLSGEFPRARRHTIRSSHTSVDLGLYTIGRGHDLDPMKKPGNIVSRRKLCAPHFS